MKKRKGRVKSKALLVQGKIKPEVYERWNRGAGGKELPEHVRKKKRKSRKRHG